MKDPNDLDLEKGLASQLAQLDVEHARSTSPGERRSIEKKMAKLRADLEEVRAKAKVVDLAYERWKRSVEVDEVDSPYEVYEPAIDLWLPADGREVGGHLDATIALPIKDARRIVVPGHWRRKP